MALKSINPEFQPVRLLDGHMDTITTILGREPTEEELFIAQVEGIFLVELEKRARGTHQIEQIVDAKLVWTAQTAMSLSEQAFEKTAMQTEINNEWFKKNTPRGFTHLQPHRYRAGIEDPLPPIQRLIIEDLEFELSTRSATEHNLPILSRSALDDFAQYIRTTVSHSDVFPGIPESVVDHIIYFKEYELFCTMSRPQYIEIVRTAVGEYGNWPGNLNIYFVATKMHDKMRINLAELERNNVSLILPKGMKLVGNYIVKEEECYSAIPDSVWSFYLLPEFACFIPLLPTAIDMQKIADMEDNINNQNYRHNYRLFPIITRFTIDKIIARIPPTHGELTKSYHKRLYAYDGFVHYGTIKRYVLKNIEGISVKSSGQYERYEYKDRPATQWGDQGAAL